MSKSAEVHHLGSPFVKAEGHLVIRIDGSRSICVPLSVDTDTLVMKAQYGRFDGSTIDPDARRYMEYLIAGIAQNLDPYMSEIMSAN
jgi:hypothetical protein